MKVNLSGLVLVLFKAQTHESMICQQAMDVVMGVEKRVVMCVVDLTKSRDIVMRSKTTTTPISSIPAMILYSNGVPKYRFNNTSPTPEMLSGFISTSLDSIKKSQPVQGTNATSARFVTTHQEPEKKLSEGGASDSVAHNTPWLADEM